MVELYGTLSGNIVVLPKDGEGDVLVYVMSLYKASCPLPLSQTLSYIYYMNVRSQDLLT